MGKLISPWAVLDTAKDVLAADPALLEHRLDLLEHSVYQAVAQWDKHSHISSEHHTIGSWRYLSGIACSMK